MIAGIGTDIIAVERMASALERHGKRFLDHIFTDSEQLAAPDTTARAAYYAARWAAKEAIAKALGTGIGARCAWTDIEIRRERSGRPVAHLTGSAAQTAADLAIAHIHISISHERTTATATAIAEKTV